MISKKRRGELAPGLRLHTDSILARATKDADSDQKSKLIGNNPAGQCAEIPEVFKIE
ncbi:MAG: hypothetical protein ABR524_02015 [Thermoanaerobaculia bacterium]